MDVHRTYGDEDTRVSRAVSDGNPFRGEHQCGFRDKLGESRGRLVVEGTAKPIGVGSVTVRHAGADTSFVGGALPNADGAFHADGLTSGTYSLRIRAIRYSDLIKANVVLTPTQPIDGSHGLVTSAACQSLLKPVSDSLARARVVVREHDDGVPSSRRSGCSLSISSPRWND